MHALEVVVGVLRDLVALALVLGIAFSVFGAVLYVGSGLAFHEPESASQAFDR